MKVGIQLYSVRNRMQEDPIRAVREVADIGYRYLEVANHNAAHDPGVGFGVSASEMRKALDDAGARVVSAHISPLDPDHIAPVLAYHGAIGTQYLVVPMDFYTCKEDALRRAEVWNAVGQKCKDAGIALLYHNHFHEFQVFDGKTVLEHLMENTQPDLFGLELDTYWAMRGGCDPVDVMRKYGERVRMIHQKDFPKGRDGEVVILTDDMQGRTLDMPTFMGVVQPDQFVEIGTGMMDIQAILDVANGVCGCDYAILEQDFTALDEMQSIRVSMQSFRALRGIEWA